MISKKHRKILAELADYCNQLGGVLDYTATHESKLKDRQRALMKVYKVLYGVLTDYPDNDNIEHDQQEMREALKALSELVKKDYSDRSGNFYKE